MVISCPITPYYLQQTVTLLDCWNRLWSERVRRDRHSTSHDYIPQWQHQDVLVRSLERTRSRPEGYRRLCTEIIALCFNRWCSESRSALTFMSVIVLDLSSVLQSTFLSSSIKVLESVAFIPNWMAVACAATLGFLAKPKRLRLVPLSIIALRYNPTIKT